MSPGNAFSCNFPSFTSRRFLCSCAKSPPLRVSCTAVTAGLPSCVWRWCSRDVVSPEALERSGCGSIPTAEGGWWAPLPAARPQSQPPRGRAHTAAGRGTSSHRHPALAPCHRPLRLTGAGAELVSSLLANESSQLPSGSFPGLVFCHINEWQWFPEKSSSIRGDASEGGSPGSWDDPPASSRDPWAWLSRLRTAARIRGDEQLGWTDDGEQGEGPAGGEGRAGSPTWQNPKLLLRVAAGTREAVTSGLLLKLGYQKGNCVNVS